MVLSCFSPETGTIFLILLMARQSFQAMLKMGLTGRRKFLMLIVYVVVLCLLASFTDAEYLKYKDPKMPLGVRILGLVGRMTLEEKIGQMIQIGREVATPDVMNKHFIGSVLNGGGSVPAPKASAEAWVNMVNEIQKGALSTRLGIPMIYGIDAVHGHNNVYKATISLTMLGLESLEIQILRRE